MILNTVSGLSGIRLSVVLTAIITMLASGPLTAQTIETVNDTEISADVFNMYLESRIQKPAAQATPTERTRFLDELKDIYLLTTQPGAEALAKTPRNKAMIELQTRGILAQAVAADFLEKNAASDAEIQLAYQEQIALSPKLEFKASHILVETQSEANSIVAELQGGANFAELAKTKSTGPSGPNGGDLGWFAPTQMVPPFSEAVASLEDGAFTMEPVQTQFGWHVILRVDSREATPPTLESVRDVVKQRVEQEKLQNYLLGLRATLNKS
ncbi:MAG: peptidylprolyl isomerase [Woeseiaceae bacterium]